MKNGPLKKNVQTAHLSYDEDAVKTVQKPANFSPKVVKSTMTDQIALPPARVWDKIEKILDEQDNRRKQVNKLIIGSFDNTKSRYSRKNLYVAAAAGVSVLAGIFWIVR